MTAPNRTTHRNQEEHKPGVDLTLLSARNASLVAMPTNNQNQSTSRNFNNSDDTAMVPQRLQQVPNDHQNLRATANNIPFPDNWRPYEQANRALFASMKTIDAHFQETSAYQARIAFIEMKRSAAASFQSDRYDHMVGGGELYSSRKRSSANEVFGGGFGEMEKDEDFRGFVREARFVDGRDGGNVDQEAPMMASHADQRENREVEQA
ncbi:hypothetical protein H2198_004375 [Neophaeococcomyces mojaviensis]|uniref:Uncharacterized protein n=1 Tax=Neophaeococcomyces mojaviensis TaxID=3383035 RepID=A0ACC3A8R5_9EURO|nr:hypothetical protein H2198_004375 [Knufia sp. JES_112]